VPRETEDDGGQRAICRLAPSSYPHPTHPLTIIALLLERLGDSVVDLLVVGGSGLEVLGGDLFVLLRVEVVGAAGGEGSTETEEEARVAATLLGRRRRLHCAKRRRGWMCRGEKEDQRDCSDHRGLGAADTLVLTASEAKRRRSMGVAARGMRLRAALRRTGVRRRDMATEC